MTKPDDIPQDIWDATESVAGVGGGHEMQGYLRSVRIRAAQLIAAERDDRNEDAGAAILAERESCAQLHDDAANFLVAEIDAMRTDNGAIDGARLRKAEWHQQYATAIRDRSLSIPKPKETP